MAERSKFWLVWSVSSERSPSKRHRTLQQAVAEAGRLTLQFPTQEFVVLEAVIASLKDFNGGVRREIYVDDRGCAQVGVILAALSSDAVC